MESTTDQPTQAWECWSRGALEAQLTICQVVQGISSTGVSSETDIHWTTLMVRFFITKGIWEFRRGNICPGHGFCRNTLVVYSRADVVRRLLAKRFPDPLCRSTQIFACYT